MSELIIAATGHRPPKVGGYGEMAAHKRRTLAYDYLLKTKPDKVISGMALGWDQDFAVAATILDIPFIAAIPCIGQDSKWPSDSRVHYSLLLSKAAEVVYVSQSTYNPYVMQARNEWMVDHATRMVALWDGSVGGTANCVKYAVQQGKEIDNLWKEWVE